MTAVELMGAPGSPYTRKMLALMRYRRIPYQISWQSFTSLENITHKDRPQPKVLFCRPIICPMKMARRKR